MPQHAGGERHPRPLQHGTPPLPAGGGALVVSGDDLFVQLVRTLLEDFDTPVRVAAPGRPALAEARRARPRLVVVDLALDRGADAWLLIEALRAGRETCTVPVVLCPLAPWQVDDHAPQLARHHLQVWGPPYDLREFLACAAAALDPPPRGAAQTSPPATPDVEAAA